jgi:GT2 family glycosyltransferase
MHVAALLTCHNRREKTLSCLHRIADQNLAPDVTLQVTLVDDNSTDGTADSVNRLSPETQIIQGNGSLFWCGGMRVAWNAAAKHDPDYYLLLNDDTLLKEDAVTSLLSICARPDMRIIAVAAIADSATGETSYGCWNRKTGLVPPNGSVQTCDTFNANCVLIPRAVFLEMGGFHAVYTHGMGDFDYGYQASKRGIRIILSGSHLGTCSRNSVVGTWMDRRLSRRVRFAKLQSKKGLPFKEWVIYNRRNTGWVWPYRCISPILRILLGR